MGEKGFCISEKLNPAMFTPLLKLGALHRGQQLLKGNVIPSILFSQIRGKSIAFSEETQEEPRKAFLFCKAGVFCFFESVCLVVYYICIRFSPSDSNHSFKQCYFAIEEV